MSVVREGESGPAPATTGIERARYMQPGESLPVFYDPVGRRSRNLRRVAWPLAVMVTSLAAIFVASVLINPVLPQLNLRQLSGLPGAPNAMDARPKAPLLIANRREQKSARAQAALNSAMRTYRERTSAPPLSPKRSSTRPLIQGFYVNWDDSSYQSLKRHLSQLDQLIPEWIRLQTGDQPAVSEIDRRALDLVRKQRPELPIIPMIHNSRDGKWEPQTLAGQIGNETSRTRLVNQLAEMVSDHGFQGVCIDFEEVPNSSQKNLLAFMRQLHTTFKQRNWTVMQAVPFDDPDCDYRDLAAANDYLLLMAYDEHWNDSDPGSIAGQPWFEAMLARRMKELDPSKTVVCIGGYGYGWSRDKETEELTFQEAVLEARDNEAKIEFDPVTRNPFFRYDDEDRVEHTVWFLDGVTAFNQMRAARGYNVAGFALWRMGSEDPSLWAVFGNQQLDAAPDGPNGLTRIVYGYDVDFEGMGEVLQFEAAPKEGSREIVVDSGSGLIRSAKYLSIPSSYVIRRTGWHPGHVALTFDDGPDEKWTPQILDILKQERVPATFFIIGENGQANPRLLKRIVAEGHDVGNHSYTHPNLGEIPGRLIELELNATQRLIESVTGRSTRLFRAPYFGDAEPQTADEVEPAAIANRLGYVIAGLRVDPDDWALPGADAIVERTLAGIENPNPDERGQVVLLHDGGGRRAQTVEALPRLIHELRARGYRFTTVSQLAGMTRDQAMPPLPPERGFLSRADAVTFYAMAVGGWALRWVFLVGIVLGMARLAFIGALAFGHWCRSRRRMRARKAVTAEASPLVSIVIAAYNEERVIVQTIRSLLASDCPRFEIIVVDDGSTDRTNEVAHEQFATESRVRLFSKSNGGKAEALNFGLRHARGEIIVALDADTLFPPHTISTLARRFDDARVGAIAGNAKVGNRINLVTRWQALEYITAQNLDRRAFASLNCITVVPGAVGAWRRDLLDQLGGFASDTLAEDQDLTLKVRKLGYKIGYEEDAVAWTEAPDTISGLAKQRFRWAFGTLQCMWKHRSALFNPRYGTLGFVAMPNVWVFQILFPLISPVMDLMFVWTLISAALERWEHPGEYAITNLKQTLFYYALFLAVDWLAAGFAFLLEKREQWSLLWWLFLQRFCYRQVMYYVMTRSVWTAMKGAIIGWGKLERKATVTAQDITI
jgi:cellulose synthase/poly-beta-1,6-N-acetylglucosamine synthase-like glycosyltransferase/peptidoglycan/xylan/chitin deacetylase (PgdA/CDA1 family)/spore germination protein YaaH